jgi:hypothetical protein
MSKIIFLDIDGVLNGIAYQIAATEDPPFIDKSRLPILRDIIDKSGAQVVLSSSWKRGWEAGCGFDLAFRQAGIDIYDVTPNLGRKHTEITAWLKEHPDTESFVILDDAEGGWGKLLPHVIITDPIHEKGLENKHISYALQILKKRKRYSSFLMFPG